MDATACSISEALESRLHVLSRLAVTNRFFRAHLIAEACKIVSKLVEFAGEHVALKQTLRNLFLDILALHYDSSPIRSHQLAVALRRLLGMSLYCHLLAHSVSETDANVLSFLAARRQVSNVCDVILNLGES